MRHDIDQLRGAAGKLIALPIAERELAFHRQLDDILPRLEARARETGDVWALVHALAEIWQIGFDIGVMELPPSPE
ncbi:MAG TPA: hypothetical protein VMP03_05105 [Methylomirabilota bacterium]|nr:hypothetical protein [Methylomirabilota bacterium]